jgi:membrane protease YdiL (CAAX protease family)
MLPLAADSGPVPALAHIAGLMGPMIAAIIVAAIVSGGGGIKRLVSSAGRLPRPHVRSAMLALSPAAIGVVTFLGLREWGVPFPEWRAFDAYPGLPAGLPVAVAALAILLLNGFGEDVGWRGLASTQLLPRLCKFRSTAVVAALWLARHAPLFCLNSSLHALWGPVIVEWAFGLICGAFALAAIYIGSGQSILFVAVWHALYNMVVATSAGAGTPAAVASTIVMIWGVLVAIRRSRQERAERRAAGRQEGNPR